MAGAESTLPALLLRVRLREDRYGGRRKKGEEHRKRRSDTKCEGGGTNHGTKSKRSCERLECPLRTAARQTSGSGGRAAKMGRGGAAVPVAGPPSQSQFFGALMVAALILVCTAVVMTDRPVWMVGEEPPMGMLRPFSEPAPAQPVYTQDQLKAMATMGEEPGATDEPTEEKSVRQQSLAEESADKEAAEREEVEREAAKAAAQKAEGTVHLDDQYAVVANAPGPLYPPTHSGQDLDVLQFGDYPADYGPHTAVRLRAQDTIVPVKMVQMSTYPIISMQDEEGVSEHAHGEPGKPVTANVLFGKALRENGLGDGEYIETVAGGLGANSEPPIDRMYDFANEDRSGVDDGTLSRVLLWATVVLVFVGGIVLLGYNLLPPGSFSRAWRGDVGPAAGDEEDGKWTRASYAPPGQAVGAPMRNV